MNKLGSYPYHQKDDLCDYSFNFTDTENNTHVSMSFRAEPEWDLHVVFQQFRKFLIASGHDIQGEIGELNFDEGSYDDADEPATWTEDNEKEMAKQYQADKFSMDNIPNNNWMFGPNVKEQTWPTDAAAQYFSQQGMKQEQNWHNTWGSSSIPALTSADFASLTVTDLQTLTTQGYSDWANINKHPTMAAITQEQIKSWTTSAPGTLGGAKVEFK